MRQGLLRAPQQYGADTNLRHTRIYAMRVRRPDKRRHNLVTEAEGVDSAASTEQE